MDRPIRVLALLSAALTILLGSKIEARSQEVVPGKSANKAGQHLQGKQRRIPKLDLDEANRTILLKSLADRVRDAEAIADPQQRVNALVNMACGQLLAGDTVAAHATLAKANSAIAELPGDLTKGLAFTSLATQLGEFGDMAEAKKAVKSAVELMKSLDSVNRVNVARGIARAQAMIGEEVGAKSALESAIEALTKMTTENQWRRSLTITVQGLIDVDEYDRALDIVDAIPDVRLDLKVSVLGTIIAKMSQLTPEAAKPILARIRATAESFPADSANADTWKSEVLSSVAAFHAESGDIAAAIATRSKLVRKDKDAQIQAIGLRSLIAIASAQAKAGDQEKAKATYAEAIRAVQGLGEESAELKAETLRSIASSQAKARLFPAALKTAESIEKDDGRKSLALSEIGNAQIKEKDLPAALSSFRRAFELAKGIKGGPNGLNNQLQISQQAAFYEAACGLAGARDFDEAVKAAQYGITQDPERRTYHSLYALSQIAGERAWAGDIDGALKAASEIEDEWNRYNAYERVAKLEGEAGAEAHACEWIGKFDDPQIRLRLTWSVIKGLAKRATNPHEDLPDLSQWKKVGTAK